MCCSVQGLQCMCGLGKPTGLGLRQRQGATPGPEAYISSHLPTPLIPRSGDCAPMKDLSPCKLGGMRLYSHASKVKVCATLLACRYRSRKRNLFSMQLRILEKSGCGFTMCYYNHLAITQTQSEFQIRRLGSICKRVCIFFKVFGKLVTFP